MEKRLEARLLRKTFYDIFREIPPKSINISPQEDNKSQKVGVRVSGFYAFDGAIQHIKDKINVTEIYDCNGNLMGGFVGNESLPHTESKIKYLLKLEGRVRLRFVRTSLEDFD